MTMKMLLFSLLMTLLLGACEQAKDAGDETARELTGSNMVKQGNVLKEQIKDIELQQQQRLQQLDE